MKLAEANERTRRRSAIDPSLSIGPILELVRLKASIAREVAQSCTHTGRHAIEKPVGVGQAVQGWAVELVDEGKVL